MKISTTQLLIFAALAAAAYLYYQKTVKDKAATPAAAGTGPMINQVSPPAPQVTPQPVGPNTAPPVQTAPIVSGGVNTVMPQGPAPIITSGSGSGGNTGGPVAGGGALLPVSSTYTPVTTKIVNGDSSGGGVAIMNF